MFAEGVGMKGKLAKVGLFLMALSVGGCGLINEVFGSTTLNVFGPSWLDQVEYEVYSEGNLYLKERVAFSQGSGRYQVRVPQNASLVVRGIRAGTVYYEEKKDQALPGVPVFVSFDEQNRKTITPQIVFSGIDSLNQVLRVVICGARPVGYPTQPSAMCPDDYENLGFVSTTGGTIKLPLLPEYLFVAYDAEVSFPVKSLVWRGVESDTWDLNLAPEGQIVNIDAPGWVSGVSWQVYWKNTKINEGTSLTPNGKGQISLPLLSGATTYIYGYNGQIPYYVVTLSETSYPNTIYMGRNNRVKIYPNILIGGLPDGANSLAICVTEPSDWEGATPSLLCPPGSSLVKYSLLPYSGPTELPTAGGYFIVVVDRGGQVLATWPWQNYTASVWTFPPTQTP